MSKIIESLLTKLTAMKMSKLLRKIEFSKIAKNVGRVMPPVAYFLMLLNWYVWKGQGRQKKNIHELAPAIEWLKRFIIPCFTSFFLYIGGRYYVDDFAYFMGDFIRSAYPSILGFAIGLYALVVSSGKYSELLNNDETKLRARLVSIDLVYPIFITLSVSVINYLIRIDEGQVSARYLGELSGMDVLGVLNVYSVMLIYEMVMVVYMDSIRVSPGKSNID